VFRECQGGFRGVQGVFCIRKGSGLAEKWTSVSPWWVAAASGELKGKAAAVALHKVGRCSLTYQTQVETAWE